MAKLYVSVNLAIDTHQYPLTTHDEVRSAAFKVITEAVANGNTENLTVEVFDASDDFEEEINANK